MGLHNRGPIAETTVAAIGPNERPRARRSRVPGFQRPPARGGWRDGRLAAAGLRRLARDGRLAAAGLRRPAAVREGVRFARLLPRAARLLECTCARKLGP